MSFGSQEKRTIPDEDYRVIESAIALRLARELPLHTKIHQVSPEVHVFLAKLFSSWMQGCREEIKARSVHLSWDLQGRAAFAYHDLLQYLCHRPLSAVSAPIEDRWGVDTKMLDKQVQRVFEVFRLMVAQHPAWVRHLDELALEEGMTWSAYAFESGAMDLINTLRGFLGVCVLSVAEAQELKPTGVCLDRGALVLAPIPSSRLERAAFVRDAREAYALGEEARIGHDRVSRSQEESQEYLQTLLETLHAEQHQGWYIQAIFQDMHPTIALIARREVKLHQRQQYTAHMLEGTITPEEEVHIKTALASLEERVGELVRQLHQAKRVQAIIKRLLDQGMQIEDPRFTSSEEGVPPKEFVALCERWAHRVSFPA